MASVESYSSCDKTDPGVGPYTIHNQAKQKKQILVRTILDNQTPEGVRGKCKQKSPQVVWKAKNQRESKGYPGTTKNMVTPPPHNNQTDI